jgi:hypothetical protein
VRRSLLGPEEARPAMCAGTPLLAVLEIATAEPRLSRAAQRLRDRNECASGAVKKTARTNRAEMRRKGMTLPLARTGERGDHRLRRANPPP